MRHPFLIFAVILCWTLSTYASLNEIIMQTLQEMPRGGGYSTSPQAWNQLQSEIAVQDAKLLIKTAKPAPSFCSSATYLVFLKVLSKLQAQQSLKMDLKTQQELLVKAPAEQPDGSGVWGRWNANGPGTARLFFELKLGRNFTLDQISEAQPGDFMKIFWNDKIGAEEKGHSVIFTGLKTSKEGREICFWSSNKENPDHEAGMGTKCVAEKKISRAIFSRLEFPERLNEAPKLMATAYSDSYLRGLLKQNSSADEMCRKIGCR
jgi:hypothetical protein